MLTGIHPIVREEESMTIFVSSENYFSHQVDSSADSLSLSSKRIFSTYLPERHSTYRYLYMYVSTGCSECSEEAVNHRHYSFFPSAGCNLFSEVLNDVFTEDYLLPWWIVSLKMLYVYKYVHAYQYCDEKSEGEDGQPFIFQPVFPPPAMHSFFRSNSSALGLDEYLNLGANLEHTTINILPTNSLQ